MKTKILLSIFILLSLTSFSQTVTEIEAVSTKQSFSIGKYANGIPYLATTQKFVEPSGNNLLDAGESAYIEIKVTNSGAGSAYNVKASMTVDNLTNITCDKNSSEISELKAGSSQTIKLYVTGKETLTDGSKKFSVTFSEAGNFIAAPFNITVNTQKMLTPLIAFVDAGIEELQGDKNNKITQGELIRVAVLIQNQGQGDANNVSATLKIDDTGIMPITGTYNLSQYVGNLTSGEAKTLYFDFSPTWGYSGSDNLPISIELSESKGKFGGIFDLGLQMNVLSIAATDVKVDGTYAQKTDIQDVSLGVDVDKNIPSIGVSYSNRYALIIGNENYVEAGGLEADVTFALNDAQIFKQYSINALGIPENNIIYMENATATKMKKEINNFYKLMDVSPEKDEFFVYYAGHGYPDKENEPYLMPVDVDADYIEDAIKLSDFYANLVSKNPKMVTVFMDACFSGGGRSGMDLVIARSGARIKPNENSISGNIAIFAATSEDQVSKPYEDKQHGLFTYFLLKSLQDSNGKLTYGELADKLEENVKKTSITVNKEQQIPRVNVSSKILNTWESIKLND